MLEEVEPDTDKHICIGAIDNKKDSTGLINFQNDETVSKRSDTGGLHTVLKLVPGARVMLTYNIDVSDGLVNGVLGSVTGFEKNSTGKVTVVLVTFDNALIGKTTIASSQWKTAYPESVPILRHEGKFEKFGEKGAQVSRYQFPLTLAWAVTIHKCQGLTLDKIVVSMKGSKKFGNGQAYVAFSRVRSLEDLYITDFDKNGIRFDKKIASEISDMVLLEPEANLEMPTSPQLMIGHLNISYFLEKLKDIKQYLMTENIKKNIKIHRSTERHEIRLNK